MSEPTDPSVDHLPDYGIQTLAQCLLEDYWRTGDPWYLAQHQSVSRHLDGNGQ